MLDGLFPGAVPKKFGDPKPQLGAALRHDDPTLEQNSA
jgi:hypothetical protein